MGDNPFVRVLVSGLMAFALGAGEPPSPPDSVPTPVRPFFDGNPFRVDWSGVRPCREAWEADWRIWMEPVLISPRAGFRGRRLPGATVVVVDRVQDERSERFLDLTAAWAPVLSRSFQVGWQSPYTAEMLSEFMGMSGTNFHPPSIPSVWYNGLVPYWVQQGWASSSGVSISAGSANTNRPMILYPNGKR
jgi:hypothetical protein